MDRFHPPGFLDDFARRPGSAEDRAKAWSAIVSSWMDGAAERYGTPEVPSLFFNPLKDETPGEPASESSDPAIGAAVNTFAFAPSISALRSLVS